MGARQKLNQAHINGCILFAAVIGFVCGSWAAFLVSVAVLVGLDLMAGNIRTRHGRSQHRP